MLHTHFFIRTFSIKTRGWKCQNLGTFEGHTDAEKRRITFVLDIAQDHGNGIFSSANFHQCNITFSVVHVHVGFKSFYLLVYSFIASQGCGQLNKAYLCFRLVCTNGSNNCTPNTNNYV